MSRHPSRGPRQNTAASSIQSSTSRTLQDLRPPPSQRLDRAPCCALRSSNPCGNETQTEMKSRRQGSGGSAAARGEGTTHSGGCKMERKDVEKNRRLHMKGLCLKLSSLIPPSAAKHASLLSAPASCSNPNKDAVTQLDHLDNAAAYIKQLKGRIEELKQRKGGGSYHTQGAAAATAGVRMPLIEVRYQDGTLEVVLVSEAGRPFKLHEVITVLEQEGAEVVSASFSVVGDKIFYTIHSQALSSRIGLEASRVSERLQDLLLLD